MIGFPLIGHSTALAVASSLGATQDALTQIAGDGTNDFVVLAREHDAAGFKGSTNLAAKKFEIKGSPILQKNSSGFQLTCNHLFGSYFIEDGHHYRPDLIHANGNAFATFDSDRAREYAKKNSLPFTVEPGVLTTLSSENIDVSEKARIDTLTMAQPYRLIDSRPGSSKEGSFKRSTTIEGKSGTFTFSVPEKPGKAKLLTGDSSGPVHLHSLTTVMQRRRVFMVGMIVPFLVKVERVLDATGDHFYADMSKKENQLTLKGHVHVNYTDLGSHMVSNELSATVDEDGNVVSVGTEGVPEAGSEGGSR